MLSAARARAYICNESLIGLDSDRPSDVELQDPDCGDLSVVVPHGNTGDGTAAAMACGHRARRLRGARLQPAEHR